jgi:hypothetical protein
MPENWADTTRTVDYQKNVEFQLNETPGKLATRVGSTKSYSGKKEQIVDRFDDMPAHEISERNGDTINTDPNVIRRWIVKPKRQAVIPLLDPDDVMSTSVDIKSPLVMGTTRSIRRAQDDRWLQGYYGVAYTGEDGSTQVPFKAANIMAADFSAPGTATGLTLAKLIRMRRLMSAAFVDMESEIPEMPVTAAQIEDLLNIPEVRSRDFNPLEKAALQEGKVATFMGFRFVPVEFGNPKAFPKGAELTVDGQGNRLVPVYVPSGLHRGVWLEFESHIDLRPDKNHSTQVAGYECSAVTRLDEDKCFLIRCKESI